MSAPAGTVTYYTTVTLNAPGNTNGDATLLAAAFNGVVFPGVSNSAATATASSAAVTIQWNQATIRVDNALARDAVINEVKALAASLNAPVTNITSSTQATLS